MSRIPTLAFAVATLQKTHTLSYAGTDGKEHCFIVNVDLGAWKVASAPNISPDIASLPEAFVYLP
jgi:hypothetical protein